MISAIRDDNPVIFMFHKGVMGLPWMAKNPRSIGPVPEEEYTVPIGKAAIVHEGTDVTVVEHLDVRAALPRRGGEARGHDQRRGPRPAFAGPAGPRGDPDSVAKTGRLVVVDEDYRSFGMSGEVVATITDKDPSMLKAPVQRVCYPDVPVPYARVLEYEALPHPRQDRGGHRGRPGVTAEDRRE